MSQFIEVEIKISDLVHDLRAGLTWHASEDKGQGSIQAKYEMEDEDIIDIQGHPAFNQPIRTFKIVDDYTKKPVAVKTTPAPVLEEVPADEPSLFGEMVDPRFEVNNDQPVDENAGALEFLSL